MTRPICDGCKEEITGDSVIIRMLLESDRDLHFHKNCNPFICAYPQGGPVTGLKPDAAKRWLDLFEENLGQSAAKQDATDDLLVRLAVATVASCTCRTKTPEPKAHLLNCRYRVLTEAHDAIKALRR